MTIFIATTQDGIRRASLSPSGEWTVENSLGGIDVRCLATDPQHSNVVFAGTQGDGVFRSEDGGRTWLPAGMGGQIVKAIAIRHDRARTVYVGTKPALMFASHDDGTTWKELKGFRRIRSRRFWFSPAEPPFSAYVQGIAIPPDNPEALLAGIEFGAVVRSADGGETWTGHRPGALRDCHTIKFHATDGNRAYEAGGNGGGAAMSRDGGLTWTRPKEGLDRHYGWACAADPVDPDAWYVSVSPSPFKAHGSASAEAHIYRSTEGGAWLKLGGGLPSPIDHMPYALLTERDHPGRVYAGLSNGDVWQSADYGETWSRLPFSFGSIRYTMIGIGD